MPAGESHRQGRAHPCKLGVMSHLLRNAGISLEHRLAEVTDNPLLVGGLEVGEPPKQVKYKRLDGLHGQGTGNLAGSVAAHSVGYEQDVALVAAADFAPLRKAGLLDP